MTGTVRNTIRIGGNASLLLGNLAQAGLTSTTANVWQRPFPALWSYFMTGLSQEQALPASIGIFGATVQAKAPA
ncbi:hypothetical protein NKI34_25700 [Mesorhizobium sp. M0700]|uniref:hypothetical protein n=1 Tax=Mesorhizobium sp. M0700 TaxID=2956988 RepID=UPI00333CA71A